MERLTSILCGAARLDASWLACIGEKMVELCEPLALFKYFPLGYYCTRIGLLVVLTEEQKACAFTTFELLNLHYVPLKS